MFKLREVQRMEFKHAGEISNLPKCIRSIKSNDKEKPRLY